MKGLILFVAWCILLLLCWPVAILVLLLLPVLWVLSIPFRIVAIVLESVLSFLRAVLLLPSRLLGGRQR